MRYYPNMPKPDDPRWRNAARYETFNDPWRALSVISLSDAIVDYAKLGLKRHRQWCRHGRDWVRRIPRKKGGFYKKIPAIYQDVREKVLWLYSQQFGYMCDILDLDLERMQAFFLRLMSGTLHDR